MSPKLHYILSEISRKCEAKAGIYVLNAQFWHRSFNQNDPKASPIIRHFWLT